MFNQAVVGIACVHVLCAYLVEVAVLIPNEHPSCIKDVIDSRAVRIV